MPKSSYDAVVIGSGPNGLAAAITLAEAGLSVIVFEAKETIGGGMRTSELTLPGFQHDICSAVHPLALNSPFFKNLPLKDYGLEWIFPPTALANPFDDGTAALLKNSVEETAATLGEDKDAYIRLMQPLLKNFRKLLPDILSPVGFPRHPFAMLQFGLKAIQSDAGLCKRLFKGERARTLFSGMAGHGMLPLDRKFTASFGLVLGLLGHLSGWPVAKGGSQKIASALEAYFLALGGEIVTNVRIKSLSQVPPAKVALFDLTPRQILKIKGTRIPDDYRRKLENFRYGVGVFKLDWALDAPVPFTAEECLQAGTVHLGGSFAEMQLSESLIWQGKHYEKPLVLLAQQSSFDPTRAPAGKHTAWAYCHVPQGSENDMTEIIENQVERFAPGFKERILARHKMNIKDFQAYNANYVGGDINGGVQDWQQIFTRPVKSFSPYNIPVQGLYICSSSTPPGGGVHGMCGFNAAQKVLRDLGVT
jgi:phytoene dehydrogenase-like protein